MGKKVRVALFGEQRRNVKLDADATEGAVVGLNLKWADGSVVQDSEIRNTAGGGGGTTVVSGTVWTGPVLWSLILSIPAFIKNLAALATTGLIVRGAAGVAATREIEGLDERIVVTDGDGVAANPTIGLTDWPVVKNSISTGESYTVPTGYQLLVWDSFTFDGGSLTLDGDLIAI